MVTNGRLMLEKQQRLDAVARAETYAPMPADNAPMSGIVGAGVVGIVLVGIASFYVIDVPTYWILFSVLLALGFSIPFIRSMHRRKKHIEATSRELRSIKAEANRNGGADTRSP